jgi:hypothetical protein
VSDEARPLKASMPTSLAKSEASSPDLIMVHGASEVGLVRRSPSRQSQYANKFGEVGLVRRSPSPQSQYANKFGEVGRSIRLFRQIRQFFICYPLPAICRSLRPFPVPSP